MTEKHDPQWYKEMRPWLTADEIYEYLANQHQMHVSAVVASWIAAEFQKVFEKGYQLGSRDGETSFIPRSLKGLETEDEKERP